MEVLARQGVTTAFPTQEALFDQQSTVVALRDPARDSAWSHDAEARVRRALIADEPVSLVLLRVDAASSGRFRRRSGGPQGAVPALVRRWRSDLREDEELLGLADGLIGLLLPGVGLDDAFTRIDELRRAASRGLEITATVAAVRPTETPALAAARAAARLHRFTRKGGSALAV